MTAAFLLLIGSQSALGKTEKMKLESYDEVLITVPGEFEIQQADTYYYYIEAEPKVVQAIDFKIVKGKLLIAANKDFETKKGIKIVLGMPSISSIDVKSSSQITSKAPSGKKQLSVVADGSGDIYLSNINSENVNLRIKGSSDVSMIGNTEKISVDISGSGSANLKKLIGIDVKAQISGSGTIEVYAKKNLNAIISGAGEILYYGNPNVTKKITGAGDVEKGQ